MSIAVQERSLESGGHPLLGSRKAGCASDLRWVGKGACAEPCQQGDADSHDAFQDSRLPSPRSEPNFLPVVAASFVACSGTGSDKRSPRLRAR